MKVVCCTSCDRKKNKDTHTYIKTLYYNNINNLLKIFLDFEGIANVKRIEIQWLKEAMPKRVDFLVNEKIISTSTLHDSSQELDSSFKP